MLVLIALDLGLGRVIGFGFDWLLIGAAIILGHFVIADVALGATLGKLLMRLRVTGPDGGRPSLTQALIRESFTVLGAIPFIGPVLALGAWIWITMTIRSSPLRQGRHDLLAGGTRVISIRSE